MIEPTEDERKEAVRLAAMPKPDAQLIELLIDALEAANDIRFSSVEIIELLKEVRDDKREFRHDWKAEKRVGKYIGMFMAATSAASVWIMIIGIMYLPEETRKLFRTILDFFGISLGV